MRNNAKRKENDRVDANWKDEITPTKKTNWNNARRIDVNSPVNF